MHLSENGHNTTVLTEADLPRRPESEARMNLSGKKSHRSPEWQLITHHESKLQLTEGTMQGEGGVMKLIQQLMGRRQFLIASGLASACTLACKKLADFIDTGYQSDAAMASERTGYVGMEGETNKYTNLLSPIKVRNKILKNRILHTPSPPHRLQGPENYPADAYRAHYSNMAKNAAIVSLDYRFGEYPKKYEPYDPTLPHDGRDHHSDHIWENIPPVHNYIDQMIEDIHCEGSLICDGIGGGMGGDSTIEEVVTQAKRYEDLGFDIVRVGRRDAKTREELGPIIEQMQAVRKATNLIIVAWLLPFSPGKSRGGQGMGWNDPTGHLAAGPELEELVAMVKMLEGSADIIQMKDTGHYTNHPNSFTMERDKPWMLRFSQAIKESGADVIVCPTGGFHDPVLIEEWIASGQTDMVGMATPFFADPEYVKKLYENRAEDIVPCIKCHDCHGISRTFGPWRDVCSVNPMWGLSETKKKSAFPPSAPRRVAVIGGGPGGMKAAIVAAERGHQVSLYEKNDALGGLLSHTDFSQYKWAQKSFKDYLVRQTHKAGVEVNLNSKATPEMIKAKGYDAVLVATGAEPIVPRIPGVDGKNVYNIVDVYRNIESLGKNVVIIGGKVFGSETGITLALSGYKVTVLTGDNYLIGEKWIGSHNKENQLDIMRSHENFNSVLEVTPVAISNGEVTYRDAKGGEKSIQADSVVIYAGLKPRMDEGLKFSGSADQVLFLGDCTGKAGTIQKTIRSAYFMASQV